MLITIYGTGTSGHQYVVHSIKNLLAQAQIDFELKEVSDVNVFLQKGIESVPAVQIDEHDVINLRSNHSFSNALRKILHHSLSKQNFGVLPKIYLPYEFSDLGTNSLVFAHRLATEMNAVLKSVHFFNGDFDIENLETTEEKLGEIAHAIEMDQGGDIMKSALIDTQIISGSIEQKLYENLKKNKPELLVFPVQDVSDVSINKIKKYLSKDHKSLNIPYLLVPPKANYHRIRNVFCLCQDYQCFENMKDYFLKFSSLFNAKFYVFCGCPQSPTEDHFTTEDNAFYLSDNLVLIDRQEINSQGKIKLFFEQNDIDFLFASENQCSISFFQRPTLNLFTDLMENIPILFFPDNRTE